MRAGYGTVSSPRFDFGGRLYPNNLVVSRSVYDNKASNVTIGEMLPPNCNLTTAGCPTPSTAQYDGAYPTVFNNVIADPSFGITSKIYLDQISLLGFRINSIEVPNTTNANATTDHLATSFSSKSEIALNLSTSGKYLSFMGYVAPVDAIDVSNSNTPLVIDPTNPVGIEHLRAVARVDASGNFTFTETNAYSGNNGRAAIYNDDVSAFYTAGNAGNGSNPQPNGVVLGAGAQWIPFVNAPEADQNPGTPMPLASFSVTELGDKADKVGKDDNFRGLTIFNNVVYFTKGSGSNGVNTVYFVDTTGTACPKGVGLPAAGAKLPANPLSYNMNTLQTTGLPSNMCILAGFPTELAKSDTNSFPFGLWFANSNTLYVADEGDGYTGGTDSVYACGGADECRLAEVGVQLADANVADGIRNHEGVEPGQGLHRGPLSEGQQCSDGTAVGSGNRRPAEHHGSGWTGWAGGDLGGDFDG